MWPVQMVPSECGLDDDWVTNPSDLAEHVLSRQPVHFEGPHLTRPSEKTYLLYLFHLRAEHSGETPLFNPHRSGNAYVLPEEKLLLKQLLEHSIRFRGIEEVESRTCADLLNL